MAESILKHARAFAGLNPVGEEGSDSLSHDSAVFDLLLLHMQLVRPQRSQQAPGKACLISPLSGIIPSCRFRCVASWIRLHAHRVRTPSDPTSLQRFSHHDTLLLYADERLEQASGHLDMAALLAVSDVITANMLKQAEDARRASRRMSA